jgi:hypothetical protein
MRIRVIACALALFLGGCGTEPEPSIAGKWTGAYSGLTMTLTLVENSGNVTGNAVLEDATGTEAWTVAGVFTPPTASLTITNPKYQPINLTGTVSASSIEGKLNGSGYSNNGITLVRK